MEKWHLLRQHYEQWDKLKEVKREAGERRQGLENDKCLKEDAQKKSLALIRLIKIKKKKVQPKKEELLVKTHKYLTSI